MLVTQLSLNALAFMALFAEYAATLANISSPIRANLSIDRSSSTANSNFSTESGNFSTLAEEFDQDFNVIFEGGQCSPSQQAKILDTMKWIAASSDNVKLWKNDFFHDWQSEVTYWFGSRSANYEQPIKSNAIHYQTFDSSPHY